MNDVNIWTQPAYTDVLSSVFLLADVCVLLVDLFTGQTTNTNYVVWRWERLVFFQLLTIVVILMYKCLKCDISIVMLTLSNAICVFVFLELIIRFRIESIKLNCVLSTGDTQRQQNIFRKLCYVARCRQTGRLPMGQPAPAPSPLPMFGIQNAAPSHPGYVCSVVLYATIESKQETATCDILRWATGIDKVFFLIFVLFLFCCKLLCMFKRLRPSNWLMVWLLPAESIYLLHNAIAWCDYMLLVHAAVVLCSCMA